MRQGAEARKEVINGSIFLLLGLAIWFYAGRFPNLPEGYPGPSLFPKMISLGFAISGLVLLAMNVPKFMSAKQDSEQSEQEAPDTRGYTLLGGLAIVGIFPFVSNLIGFIPTLGMCVFGIALLLRIPYLKGGLIAIGTLATIYLTFNVLLGVPL